MSSDTIQWVNASQIAQPAGHYSHATVCNGFVFVSGQLPITPAGEKLVQAPFEAQARQVLDNVKAILEASGSSIASLLQVRVYVTSVDHWPAFNKLYAEWAGSSRPARCVVPVGALHHGLQIEMEVTAVVDR